MTNEDKKLVLKDLSARLPYNVKVLCSYKNKILIKELGINTLHNFMFNNIKVIPYLRPMSSITKEEKEELIKNFRGSHTTKDAFEELSWYLSKHLDVNGLIPKGLAIEITKENNPYKE